MVNVLDYLNISKGMSIAAIEALKSNPNPNPKVGAALFDKNMNLKNISHHVKKGDDHAEISLIKHSNIEDDDYLYVTLEPCFHDDTSPSCAKELLKTSIKNIIIGDIDIDIRTSGKSYDYLKNNDVNVSIEAGVNELINPYYENITNSSPVTYLGKIGISSNNFIYDSNSEDRYITNDISLDVSHILRATCDAVLVGKNTFIVDKPLLNIRNLDLHKSNNVPLKIIWWGSRVPKKVKNNENFKEYIFIESNSLNELENILIKNNCRTVLVEGGKYIHELFFENNMYYKFYEFRSENIIDNGLYMNFSDHYGFKNKYIKENNFLLKDNQLIIYTRK